MNAMTSYGHERLHLAAHWQMMGALEALKRLDSVCSRGSISFRGNAKSVAAQLERGGDPIQIVDPVC